VVYAATVLARLSAAPSSLSNQEVHRCVAAAPAAESWAGSGSDSNLTFDNSRREHASDVIDWQKTHEYGMCSVCPSTIADRL